MDVEKTLELPLLNGDTATFECIFGRGCDGLCCRNGRPSVTPDEQQRIDDVLEQVLPELRPQARSLIEREGFVSRRQKLGQPMLRVIDEWCVFFNGGCVLHKLGAAEGRAYHYKPVQCALFPLDQDSEGNWFIRQHDYLDEPWDLFCLDPAASSKPAVESLAEEIELAARIMTETIE